MYYYWNHHTSALSGNDGSQASLYPKEPKYLKVVWGVGYKIEKLS